MLPLPATFGTAAGEVAAQVVAAFDAVAALAADDAGILSTMDEDGQDEPQTPKTRTN